MHNERTAQRLRLYMVLFQTLTTTANETLGMPYTGENSVKTVLLRSVNVLSGFFFFLPYFQENK